MDLRTPTPRPPRYPPPPPPPTHPTPPSPSTAAAQTLINFITGLTVSVFAFLVQLPRVILSYQPALWSALGFFALAAVAAVSVVASYLGLLVGAAGTAAYATLSMVAAQQQRLQHAEAQRRRIHQE